MFGFLFLRKRAAIYSSSRNVHYKIIQNAIRVHLALIERPIPKNTLAPRKSSREKPLPTLTPTLLEP
jgi:hypothetical protein